MRGDADEPCRTTLGAREMKERRPGSRRRTITPMQLRVLDFVRDFIRARRYSPSLAEIAEAMGWSSVSTAAGRVDALVRAGRLRRDWNLARTLEVVEDGQHCPTCRCDVAAGFLPQETRR